MCENQLYEQHGAMAHAEGWKWNLHSAITHQVANKASGRDVVIGLANATTIVIAHF